MRVGLRLWQSVANPAPAGRLSSLESSPPVMIASVSDLAMMGYVVETVVGFFDRWFRWTAGCFPAKIGEGGGISMDSNSFLLGEVIVSVFHSTASDWSPVVQSSGVKPCSGGGR
ncbi:hypothetical protein HID58_040669 [Brassica napus]|uniref:Uncharacterized protein n=1 Tax=Brassica napus TaxID=3708 RepID=A0ABQ8B8Q2_BRANA|nr:hypothetical protein HID58_040669 [Brassica napus]